MTDQELLNIASSQKMANAKQKLIALLFEHNGNGNISTLMEARKAEKRDELRHNISSHLKNISDTHFESCFISTISHELKVGFIIISSLFCFLCA
jgi:hypothetical protein